MKIAPYSVDTKTFETCSKDRVESFFFEPTRKYSFEDLLAYNLELFGVEFFEDIVLSLDLENIVFDDRKKALSKLKDQAYKYFYTFPSSKSAKEHLTQVKIACIAEKIFLFGETQKNLFLFKTSFTKDLHGNTLVFHEGLRKITEYLGSRDYYTSSQESWLTQKAHSFSQETQEFLLKDRRFLKEKSGIAWRFSEAILAFTNSNFHTPQDLLDWLETFKPYVEIIFFNSAEKRCVLSSWESRSLPLSGNHPDIEVAYILSVSLTFKKIFFFGVRQVFSTIFMARL